MLNKQFVVKSGCELVDWTAYVSFTKPPSHVLKHCSSQRLQNSGLSMRVFVRYFAFQTEERWLFARIVPIVSYGSGNIRRAHEI